MNQYHIFYVDRGRIYRERIKATNDSAQELKTALNRIKQLKAYAKKDSEKLGIKTITDIRLYFIDNIDETII